MNTIRQLALAVQLKSEATFSDFCWGDNALLQRQLQQSLEGRGENLIYLWGTPGCGKSHLLQACCHAVQTKQSAIYLPLHTAKAWGPEAIEGVDQQDLIAIDDIDAIASDPAWEEALFHLYNRVRDKGQTRLIITGNAPPTQLPLRLRDLQSRLGWGLVIQLQELGDADKISTLTLHARLRGFELPAIVGQFLLNRCARNMHDLHELLNQLDEASLMAQRKITIPFVKRTLGL